MMFEQLPSLLSEPFPDLPHDIERLIFEKAAEEDRNMALQLVLVARHVQQWIDPYIYRAVTLKVVNQAATFLHTLKTSQKPPAFFTTHVKIICLTHTIELRQIIDILSICTGVTSLACWLGVHQNLSDLPELTAILTAGTLRPKRLSANLTHLLCILDFRSSFFQNITHLDIILNPVTESRWDGLNDLGTLSHLSIDLQAPPEDPIEIVENILSHCPVGLRVFILFCPELDNPDWLDPMADMLGKLARGDIDPRVVLATMLNQAGDTQFEGPLITCPLSSLVRDWGCVPSGVCDFWEEAEQLLEKRGKKLGCGPNVVHGNEST